MTGPPLGSTGATVEAQKSSERLGPYALVCLGGIPWGHSWKRNQSMVYELADSSLFDRVLFVNPKEMWLRDELTRGGGSMRARSRRILDSLPRQRGRNLTTLTLIRCLPFKKTARWALRAENRGFRTYLNRLLGGRPFILLNNHPNFYWSDLLAGLMGDAELTVYDLSDDFLEFHQIQRHRDVIAASLEYCCSRSDLVLAVNPHVADRYRIHNPNVHVVLNATNVENFQRPSYARVAMLERIRTDAEAVFGYAGIINRVRLDYELLRRTLDRRPHWHLVLVGSADPSFLDLVERYPNLHHHPAVDYHLLPDWLHGFDAVIVPFEHNAHTQGNDLLKVNDALAMGKPVVVAGVRSLDRYGDLVRVARHADEFLSALEASRVEKDPELMERRRAFARENSWRHRAQEVQDILEQALREKRDKGASR